MAQRYEYQDIDGHVILLFVHPANLHKRKQNKNKEAGKTKKDDFQHCWKSSSVRPQGLEPWTN